MSSGTLYGDNGDDDGFGDGDTEHEAEGIADGSLAPDETVRKNYFSRPLKCDEGQSFNREKVGKKIENISIMYCWDSLMLLWVPLQPSLQ